MTPLFLIAMTRLQPTLVMLLLSLPLFAWSHGGEEHGDEAAAPATANHAPRAVARTDAFELVAVLDHHAQPPQLTVYLDQADTNAPIENAKLEVEGGAVKAQAQAREAGVYTLDATAWHKPGRYPLSISVESPSGSDLLDTTLLVPDDEEDSPSHAHEGGPLPARRWLLVTSALAVLATLVALGWRARSRTRRSDHSHTHMEA